MNQKALTTLEMFVFLLIFCAIIISIYYNLFARVGKQEAQISAVAYINRLYPELTDLKAVCVSSDGNGDGYVSCSVSGLDKREERISFNIECSNIECKAKVDN